jgi:Ni/Fe-hydrogenase subunit HybB-like protein
MDNDKKFNGLRRFNLLMGFLHLIQGILMIVLSNDKAYPIYTSFLKFDLSKMALVPDLKLASELRFGPAVAVFC